MVRKGVPNILQRTQEVVIHRGVYIPFWCTDTFQLSRVFFIAPCKDVTQERGKASSISFHQLIFSLQFKYSTNFHIPVYYHNDSGRCWKLAPQILPTHDKTKLNFLLWNYLRGTKVRSESSENWKFGLRQVFQWRGSWLESGPGLVKKARWRFAMRGSKNISVQIVYWCFFIEELMVLLAKSYNK